MFKISWSEQLVQSAIAVGIDTFLLGRINSINAMLEEAFVVFVSAVVAQQILRMITYTETNQ